MSRAGEKVSLHEAKARLVAYRDSQPPQLHGASMLAQVIWPNNSFLNAQGAGAAASRVLKKLGCQWKSRCRDGVRDWGYSLTEL